VLSCSKIILLQDKSTLSDELAARRCHGRQGRPEAPWGWIPAPVVGSERSWQGGKHPEHMGMVLSGLGDPLVLSISAQSRGKKQK